MVQQQAWSDIRLSDKAKLWLELQSMVRGFLDSLANGRSSCSRRSGSFWLGILIGSTRYWRYGLEAKTLDKYFVLLAEHDFNASTFTARTTASTLSDIYSAIVSAVGALKGDLHGSANSRSMECLIAIGDVSKVEAFVDTALANKKKLMGFGHRVYKGPDPRADDLRPMAKALAKDNPEQAKWYEISEKLEKTVWNRKKLNCNVDFYSASVLYTIGIPIDLFTTMFAVSRLAGWVAHVLEQYGNNRLIRPISNYNGSAPRAYVPIQARK